MSSIAIIYIEVSYANRIPQVEYFLEKEKIVNLLRDLPMF